jgi:hypothetical protein
MGWYCTDCISKISIRLFCEGAIKIVSGPSRNGYFRLDISRRAPKHEIAVGVGLLYHLVSRASCADRAKKICIVFVIGVVAGCFSDMRVLEAVWAKSMWTRSKVGKINEILSLIL